MAKKVRLLLLTSLIVLEIQTSANSYLRISIQITLWFKVLKAFVNGFQDYFNYHLRIWNYHCWHSFTIFWSIQRYVSKFSKIKELQNTF